MNCRHLLLTLGMLIIATSALAINPKTNLIKNPDFKIVNKNFPSQWKYYGHRSADVWVKVTNNNLEINDNNVKQKVGICQVIDHIKPRYKYLVQVSCKALKLQDKEGAFLQLRFLPSKRRYQTKIDISSIADFKTSSVLGIAPKGTKSAEVYIYTSYKNSPGFLIRDVKMYKLGKNKSIKPVKLSISCPEKIPEEWLSKTKHPLLVCSRNDYFRVRKAVDNQAWIKSYLKGQQKKCDYFITLSNEDLKALVPPPGSTIVYGLGYNTDPIKGERLQWCGWQQPFKVKDKAGNIYPNAKWKDDMYSTSTKNHSNKYYFTARAYGFVHKQLEQVVIPALADCYALTGKKDYARAAAVLLDSVAAAYSKNRRGPVDYPTARGQYDRGGRLDRAYYMVARGLYNYAVAIDLIASSGELEKTSLAIKGKSIRENIIRNMLWDGGLYCLAWAMDTKLLTNGRTDYFRGSGVVGALLGERKFFDPMLDAMHKLIDINIDRNGFYYETSSTYENHTINLYTTMAELIEASIAAHNWKHVTSIYSNEKFCKMISDFFNRREIGGHMPPIGDDGPDSYWNSPLYRDLSLKNSFANRFLKKQINNAWLMLVRGKTLKKQNNAAALLRNSFPEKKTILPNADRWAVFHIGSKQLKQIEDTPLKNSFFETKSTFYGAKGLALLRGGEGEKRYGAQLFWGPISIHGQWDIMSWQFVSDGVQWSFVPGYCNTHFRFGWNSQSVSHQMMTVNEKSVKKGCGNGRLETWFDSPKIQWVSASHSDAYFNYGVKEYKRLIAQVQNPKNGKLAYWLDIGMVDGGKVRDDSFHTVMTKTESKLIFAKPSNYSLFGDMYKGMSFGSDYKLSGFRNKGFYWIPPGDGYGFLKNPKSCTARGTQRILFSAPGFKLKEQIPQSNMVVDFASQPDSKLFMPQSPGASSWVPSVPYVIRRHTGNTPSVFTKVIRVMQRNESDPIKKVSMLNVSSESLLANACVVEWKNGNRDIWFVGDGSAGEIMLGDGNVLSCDASVAVITLDPASKVTAAKMSAGTYLQFGEFRLSGEGVVTAKVQEIKNIGQNLQLSVLWSKVPKSKISNGQLMTSAPPLGLDSTWKIKEVVKNKILLNDFSVAIGTTIFTPVSGMSGWFYVETPISRFHIGKRHCNRKFAKGKRIAVDGKVVATIAECKAGMYRLVNNKQNYTTAQKFKASVVELAPGDKLSIPMNASWQQN